MKNIINNVNSKIYNMQVNDRRFVNIKLGK